MRIKLKNFKKHLDKELILPDHGLILLSGKKGAGKSSILNAIYYALFGTIKKPYSFGTNTTSVTLEYLNLEITRTSSPNTVMVKVNGHTYEKEAAQGVINDRLKQDSKMFMLASYIVQKNNSSILSLPPTEQLALIHLLALDNKEVRYKEIIKELIRVNNEELSKIKAKYEYIQETYDKFIETFESVENPMQDDEIEKFKTRIDKFNDKMSKLLDKQKQINILLEKKKNLENKISLKSEKMANYKESLQEKESTLREWKAKLENIPDDLNKEIQNLRSQIEYNENNVALERYKQELTEIKAENAEIKKAWIEIPKEQALEKYENLKENFEISELLVEIPLKEKNVKKLKEIVKQEIIKLTEKITKLQDNRTRYLKQESDSKTLKKCPKCKTFLIILGNELVVSTAPAKAESHFKEILAENEKDLGIAQSKLLEVREYNAILKDICDDFSWDPKKQEEYDHLKEYVKINSKLESENKDLIQAHKINQKKLQEKIQNLKTILELKKEFKNNIPPQNMQDRLSELTHLSENIKDYKTNHEATNRKCNEIIKNINELQDIINQSKLDLQELKKNNPDLKSKDNEITESIKKLKKQHSQDQEILEIVNKYLEYKKNEEELVKLQENLEKSEKECKKKESEYHGYLSLKEKYIKAEILSLNLVMNNINDRIDYFLDKFFIGNKLKAWLEIIEAKNGLKIDTKIMYQGEEYDKMNDLSGGEFDLCTLASICGINTLLYSPILMLDESLSSLDSQTNTETINILKEMAVDKLIIVCSHEAVRGIFDEIIPI